MSFGPEEYPESYPPQAAPNTGRVVLPGVFLIVTAAINLVLAGFVGLGGYTYSQLPHAEMQLVFDDFQGKLNAEQRAQLTQMGITGPEDLRNFIVRWFLGLAAVWGLVALPTLLGGILACARKARGLAILGAITALLPIVSPSACPCIFGMAVGIWALVVFFSPDGIAAFQHRES